MSHHEQRCSGKRFTIGSRVRHEEGRIIGATVPLPTNPENGCDREWLPVMLGQKDFWTRLRLAQRAAF
jgi:hypothetical protein